jgi:hypothetical protein
MQVRNLLSIASLAFAISAPVRAAEAPALEEGVLLNTSDLLPPDLLRGTTFRFREQVATDGFMAHFEIDSDFGTFTAVGVPQAKARVIEIQAIGKLVETSKSDLFAQGLRNSIVKPIDAVANIVSHPVETVKQAPKTVGHFFGKIGSSIERTADKVARRSSGEEPKPSAAETGRGVGNAVKNAAGFDKAKLDTAKQLGVDPYSDNARLQEEMDKVTWAFFAGGLPLRIGAAVASAGVALAATNMAGVPEDTYALTQSELLLRDRQALESMNVDAADVADFMASPLLSTTRRHRLVTMLAGMPTVGGRGWMIRLANQCETGEQADFLIEAMSHLARHHTLPGGELKSLKIIGRLPGALDTNGELIVPAPVDHVTWTAEVAAFANRDDLGSTPKALVHTGTLSERTKQGFAAAGWKIRPVTTP